ncbi:MAG: hypothetical protein E6H77_14555, partial [Betaproteobacteria bacterium]
SKNGHQPRPQGDRGQARGRAQGGAGREPERARIDVRGCRRHAESADRDAREERAPLARRQAAAPAHHHRPRARRAQPQEPEISFDFDLFTIGGGSGGVRASRVSASYGAKVAIAESGLFGGTCVNVGCIPKKLFSYAAHWREEFEIAEAYGWSTSRPKFDWRTLLANKDKEIARLNAVYERVLRAAGVEILRGRATIVDPHTVEVSGRRYSAKHILVATGSWPVIPAIEGREHAITSNEAFHLERLPERALVVGGGYIALEFASILQGLGVSATLSYRGKRLLRGFDADLGERIAEEMTHKGVNIHFGGEPARRPTSCSSPPAASRTPRILASSASACSSRPTARSSSIATRSRPSTRSMRSATSPTAST